MRVVFFNPITNQEEYFELNHQSIDYHKWRTYNQECSDNLIRGMLIHYIVELDCTREYKSGRPMMTTFPIYQLRLSDYYYWLCKVINQFDYNKYIDLLIKRHIDNLVFEHNNPYIKLDSKKKVKSTKKKVKDSWVRQNTKDLFTEIDTYIYQNVNTGKYLRSDNPDLLEELNKPKKRSTKKDIDKGSVSMDSMFFSFKND